MYRFHGKHDQPEWDSELALLMRAMADDLEKVKAQIEAGDSVFLSLDHEKILTAHATEPEKAASAEFQAYANHYLETLEVLKIAGPEDFVSIYSNLVDGCASCHQAMCPGPLVRIRKLQLPGETGEE